MENKIVSFDPIDGSDMLEKMKNFASVSSDMTKIQPAASRRVFNPCGKAGLFSRL